MREIASLRKEPSFIYMAADWLSYLLPEQTMSPVLWIRALFCSLEGLMNCPEFLGKGTTFSFLFQNSLNARSSKRNEA